MATLGLSAAPAQTSGRLYPNLAGPHLAIPLVSDRHLFPFVYLVMSPLQWSGSPFSLSFMGPYIYADESRPANRRLSANRGGPSRKPDHVSKRHKCSNIRRALIPNVDTPETLREDGSHLLRPANPPRHHGSFPRAPCIREEIIAMFIARLRTSISCND